MPRTRALVLLAVLAGASLTGCKVPDGLASGSPAGAQPTGTAAAPPIAPGEAKAQLAQLKVAVRGTLDGYSREKFPHWDKVDGAWDSEYDGETWKKASDVDIDHMVPLGQAWVSGAKSWTQERREQFANDLVRPQLHAVTDNLNEQKSDKAPDQWKPPLVSY